MAMCTCRSRTFTYRQVCSRAVKAFRWPPRPSTASIISCTLRVFVPLKKRCSRKWATPACASDSFAEPVRIHIPTDAECKYGSCSIANVTPFSKRRTTAVSCIYLSVVKVQPLMLKKRRSQASGSVAVHTTSLSDVAHDRHGRHHGPDCRDPDHHGLDCRGRGHHGHHHDPGYPGCAPPIPLPSSPPGPAQCLPAI